MGTITRGIANNILGSGAVDGTDGLSGTVPANNIANASLNNLTAFPASVDAGIPSVAGNPPSPSDGDVWYNSVTYKLRVRGVAAPGGSWASSPSLNTARSGQLGAGTYTAALLGGSDQSPTAQLNESWNGTAWTEVADLNTALIKSTGFGATNTAAIRCSGATPPGSASALTESWNGSSWTEVGDQNQTTEQRGSVSGTSTAGLIFGGQLPGPPMQAASESWNGSSWTETNNLNTARYVLAGSGSNTAGLAFGGNTDPGNVGITESWNGTSWTEVADLNTARNTLIGFGTQTATIATGGASSGVEAKTEVWNGSSWAEVGDLSTARTASSRASSGTTLNGLVFGGSTGSVSAVSETWTGAADNLDVTLS